jgi:hypothetical protein
LEIDLGFLPRMAWISWTTSFYLCFLSSWDDKHMPPTFSADMGFHELFCSCWPVSVSHRVGMTGVTTLLLPSFCNEEITAERDERVVREGVGAGGRNELSLVCTYE